MPSAPPAVELLSRPPHDLLGGRVFTTSGRVRLGDVDRAGKLRLDATARMLQDVATDDASDAELDRGFGWLVRRTLIEVTRPGVLGESVDVSTWCTGIGPAWAERRSQVVGQRGAQIDAVSLWVQVDVATGRATRIGDDFLGAYAATAAGRAVSGRLSIPGPPDPNESTDDSRDRVGGDRIGWLSTTWGIRRTDIDPFGHVNNAATWGFLEECAALDGADTRAGVAEMEYLLPVEHGIDTTVTYRSGGADGSEASLLAWLRQDGQVRAAARWTPAR